VIELSRLSDYGKLAERKAKDTLRESEAIFRQLVLNSPDTIYLLNIALKKTEFLNRNDFLGYSREELESSDSILYALHPDDRAMVTANWKQVLQGTPDGQRPIEYRLQSKTSSWEWVQSRASALNLDKQGKPEQILVTLTVITERKKAEEAVAVMNEKLSNILESIVDGFFALDVNMNFTYANKRIATVYGYSPEDILGRNIWEIFPKARDSIHEQNYREVLLTKVPKNFEVKSIYVQSWFEYNVFPTADGISIFVRDITARKQLQDKLEEYSEDLERLVEQRTKQLKDSERLATIGSTAGMVGHDIRNPLQAIVGDIYLLNSELALKPEGKEKNSVKESLEDIQKNIDYINKIVADLQDFARPLLPHAEEADLKLIVDELLAKNDLTENVMVSVKVDAEAEKVLADRTFINRILCNLVNNAVQAMPEGGKLTIHAYKETNDVIITIKDTGVGIPKDVQNKLFTPMFTTKSKGQGFGLAVVKRMTEALGGTVTFDSQVGKGTTFKVRLPLHKELNGKWKFK
jgi:PAS domain S-box-containing protein